MDRARFDALTRSFASTQSRRSVLGTLLAVALLGHGGESLAKPGKAVGKGHHNSGGKGHGKGKGRGHDRDEPCASKCPDDAVSGEPGFCCKDGACSCGGRCCGDRCFLEEDGSQPPAIVKEFCCTGPKLVFCAAEGRAPQCCENVGEDPCAVCLGPSGLIRSYRRP
jgi:hypothetical protein